MPPTELVRSASACRADADTPAGPFPAAPGAKPWDELMDVPWATTQQGVNKWEPHL